MALRSGILAKSTWLSPLTTIAFGSVRGPRRHSTFLSVLRRLASTSFTSRVNRLTAGYIPPQRDWPRAYGYTSALVTRLAMTQHRQTTSKTVGGSLAESSKGSPSCVEIVSGRIEQAKSSAARIVRFRLRTRPTAFHAGSRTNVAQTGFQTKSPFNPRKMAGPCHDVAISPQNRILHPCPAAVKTSVLLDLQSRTVNPPARNDRVP